MERRGPVKAESDQMEWRGMGRGRKGRDSIKRDGTGCRGTGQDGEGVGGEERDIMACREGRDRMERKLEAGTERDQMERRETRWNRGLDGTKRDQMERRETK